MILFWLVTLPLIGAMAVALVPEKSARSLALLTSVIGLALAAILYALFDGSHADVLQFPVAASWIPSLRIQFALGVDGLSLPLVVLTKLMVPIAILASWNETRSVRAFMAAFLVLDSAMTGTFLATDLFLFYVFWELLLIPMLLLIGVWGGTQRVYASLKFFLFTFAGSVLMLVALFWIFWQHYEQFQFYSSDIRNFALLKWNTAPVIWGLTTQDLVFLGFTLAFAIKIPLFPFHTWLPDAHVQAPTGGSILLAAVLLKMGTYGLLRFSIPIAPESFIKFSPCLAALSLIGILYGAWVAFQQTDIKKLVAYSSVSHLGFVMLGICAMNPEGLSGALIQNINHGLSTGALFLLVGVLYERRHSRNFADFGGLAAVMPWFAVMLVFVSASSMGVPGLNGFVGEFLILLGAFRTNPVWAAVGVLGVIFGAAYLLLMLREVLFGETRSAENHTLKDLNGRDWLSLVPLCFLILALGVYPEPLFNKMRPQIDSYWVKALKQDPVTQRVTKETLAPESKGMKRATEEKS